jgi:hypothetical protein
MTSRPGAFTPWALLAGSSTGSTWVNHVLSSHPCVSSVGEILLSNASASKLFHSNLRGSLDAVLEHVVDRNMASLKLKQPSLSSPCARTAGGVKLKFMERDVTVGKSGNAAAVALALQRHGFQVILLRRTNHLDSVIGRLSRRQTGTLHCRRAPGASGASSTRTGCDPSLLNRSIPLLCGRTRDAIDRLRLRQRASDALFEARSSQQASDGSGRVLLLEYEHLVGPNGWRDWHQVMSLLRLLPAERQACSLRDTEYQKRVVQTQREFIANWDRFSACMRRLGPAYARLLQPDRRPVSGTLPWRRSEVCAAAPPIPTTGK